MDEKLKLRLIVNVDYNPNGVSKEKLMDQLKSIVDHAADNGLLSGDTEATVEEWHAEVEEL